MAKTTSSRLSSSNDIDLRGSTSGIRGTGVRTVYETLKRGILDLSMPPGCPLDEMQLSKQFSLSRTPIREALVRLASEGLVTTLPNRNTIVSQIDFAQMPFYFDALTLMHRMTTRLAAKHRTAADVDTMRRHQSEFASAVHRQDALSMIASNRDFHVAIAAAGRNPYYAELFTRLLDEGRRIARLYYSSFDDKLPERYVQEHEDIIAAIEAGNVELCDRLATQHAAQVVQQIQNFIGREIASDVCL